MTWVVLAVQVAVIILSTLLAWRGGYHRGRKVGWWALERYIITARRRGDLTEEQCLAIGEEAFPPAVRE